MTKRFVSVIAAASIALTGFAAAPASAGGMDNGELARLIFGTGAVLMLGTAIANQNKNRNRNDVVIRRNPPPRYHPRNDNVIVVPSYCVQGHGQNKWVDWGCVRQSGY